MKFKRGDRVRKIKGYKFEGIVISGGYKLDGGRILYSVEILKYTEIFCSYCNRENNIEQNCGGMVHIFAEGDLELLWRPIK